MVTKDYVPRQTIRHWVIIVACVSLLVGQAGLGVQATEQKHSRIQLSGTKLTDEEFYKLLNKKLGNNYESLQVTIAASATPAGLPTRISSNRISRAPGV
jgi:hypothetical protein